TEAAKLPGLAVPDHRHGTHRAMAGKEIANLLLRSMKRQVAHIYSFGHLSSLSLTDVQGMDLDSTGTFCSETLIAPRVRGRAETRLPDQRSPRDDRHQLLIVRKGSKRDAFPKMD